MFARRGVFIIGMLLLIAPIYALASKNAESPGKTTKWKVYKTDNFSLRYPPDFKVESLQGQSGGGYLVREL